MYSDTLKALELHPKVTMELAMFITPKGDYASMNDAMFARSQLSLLARISLLQKETTALYTWHIALPPF